MTASLRIVIPCTVPVEKDSRQRRGDTERNWASQQKVAPMGLKPSTQSDSNSIRARTYSRGSRELSLALRERAAWISAKVKTEVNTGLEAFSWSRSLCSILSEPVSWT